MSRESNILAALLVISFPSVATPVSAQGNQPSDKSANVCSGVTPDRSGMPLGVTDRLEITARGLEAADTVKALLLSPEHLRSAQWCLEDDGVARKNSFNHWLNIAPGQQGAVLDRFINKKETVTFYVIRVEKGGTFSTRNPAGIEANYVVVVDQAADPNLVMADYFSGWPNTDKIFSGLRVRGRINRADGKTTLYTSP